VADEAFGFGRVVRFGGFDSTDAATTGVLTGSGAVAGRRLSQAGVTSVGANSGWRMIAAGTRTGASPNVPASGRASGSTAGASPGDASSTASC
jgi:hypothetical protein